MNENYQNNGTQRTFNNQVSVSTAMITIWDSMTGAQLKLSALNSGLGVAIWLPEVNPYGSRKYPSELRHNVVLTQKNVVAFDEIINTIILRAYEKGENARAGVFTNNANSSLLEVEVAGGDFYIKIHRNGDPVSKLFKDTVRFKFDSSTIVTDYDTATGQMKVTPIQADFFVFAKALRAYNDLAGGYIAAHGYNIASAQVNQRFMEYVRAIADSVHAQLPAPTYQQNGGYQPHSNTGIATNYNVDNVAASGNLPNITPTEVTNLSDLIG